MLNNRYQSHHIHNVANLSISAISKIIVDHTQHESRNHKAGTVANHDQALNAKIKLENEWEAEEEDVDEEEPSVICLGVLVELSVDNSHENWVALYVFGELAVDEDHDVLDGVRFVVSYISFAQLLPLNLFYKMESMQVDAAMLHLILQLILWDFHDVKLHYFLDKLVQEESTLVC